MKCIVADDSCKAQNAKGLYCNECPLVLAETGKLPEKFTIKLARLHGVAAMKCGRSNSCGDKVKYSGFKAAVEAVIKMKLKKDADLEPYPCVFCGGWHIGRKMTLEEVLIHARS